MGFRILYKNDRELSIRVFDSVKSSDLRDIAYSPFRTHKLTAKKEIIVALLKPITRNRIENALKLYSRTDENVYKYMDTIIHFIQPIKSVGHLEEKLKNVHIK